MRNSRTLVAAAVAAAVTVAWLAPVVARSGTSVLGGPSDLTSTVRQFDAAERRGESPFTFSHDPSLGAPEGTDYSWAVEVANAVQPAFTWLVHDAIGWIAAFNLFLLLGFASTALSAFVLFDRLALHPLAAAFGAYVVAFNPYAFARAEAGHVNLVHNWVLVVVLLALLRFERARRPIDGAAVGAAVAVAFYMHTYLGAMAVLVALVFAAVDAVRRRAWRVTAVGVAAAAAVLVVALVPAAVAAALDDTSGQLATQRAEAGGEFAAGAATYLRPPDRNPLVRLVSDTETDPGREPSPGSLYFGITTVALALSALVLLRRGRGALTDPRRRYAAVAAAVLVPIAVAVTLPGASGVLAFVVPAIRVHSRFGILALLGLAILAALALDVLVRRKHGALIGAAALALVAVELAAGPPLDVWRADRPPQYVAWLAQQPKGTAAVYPAPGETPEEDEHARAQVFFQTRHHQPLFFTDDPRKGRGWAIRELADNLDEPGVPELLASQHVRYVVVNDDVYRAIGEQPPYVPETLRLLRRFDGARAFEVVAPTTDVDRVLRANAARVAAAMGIPAPTVDIPGAGFHDPERSSLDGRMWRWLIQSGVLVVDVPQGDYPFELKAIAFSAFRNRTLSLVDEDGRVLGEADIGTADAHFTIGPFRLPEGESELRLKVSPPPEPLGGADTRHASIFLSPVEIRPLADYSRR